MLGMVYSAVEHALPFVVETSLALGLAVFDGQEGIIHRPGGLMGVRLTSESRPVRYGPELQQVLDSVDAMTPRGGPSYLVLERSNGNYAQTAGGDGSFTAEWREVSGNSFRHWVAGLPGQSVTKSIKIKTNGATVIVKENEGLGATDVKAILTAFAKQTARPADYLWRETTDQFA
ncbi:MAG TPA: hypothetical protein VHR72_12590 [Gemmataceae bacterium]|nr:hypothetical protein [Gemmataceae bacterium]